EFLGQLKKLLFLAFLGFDAIMEIHLLTPTLDRNPKAFSSASAVPLRSSSIIKIGFSESGALTALTYADPISRVLWTVVLNLGSVTFLASKLSLTVCFHQTT